MRSDATSSTRRAFAAFLLAISAVFFSPTLPGAVKSAPAAFAPAPVEYVKTFADDCVTPKTTFGLGETVCAQAGGFPIALTARYRRFQWASPDGFTVELTNIKVDPQSDKFIIPTTGQFAQYGTWTVATIDADSDRYAVAKFIVRNPRLPLANLGVIKAGPGFVHPGDTVSFKIRIYNPGPDFAEGIEIVDEVPTNMTFVALKQSSGPLAECTTPARGETGRSVCKAKGLSAEESMEVVAYYTVNRDAKEGAACTSTTQVSSSTEELNKEDNFIQSEVTVAYPGEETGGR